MLLWLLWSILWLVDLTERTMVGCFNCPITGVRLQPTVRLQLFRMISEKKKQLLHQLQNRAQSRLLCLYYYKESKTNKGVVSMLYTLIEHATISQSKFPVRMVQIIWLAVQDYSCQKCQTINVQKLSKFTFWNSSAGRI